MTVRRFVLAAALALALPAGAAETPTVSSVLKRWVEATGGEKAWKGVKGATYRADSALQQIKGTQDVAVARDTFRRVTTEQGDTQEEAVAAGGAWLRDWNGHVRDVQGRDRADQRAEALIEALLFAGSVVDAAKLAPTLLPRDDAHPATVLRFAPKEVASFDVTIDDATGLPSKFTRNYFGDDVLVVPSDWRAVDKVKVPFAIATGGGEADDQDTTALSLYAPAKKALPVPARPEDGPRDVFFANSHAALSIPFNFENDHLMVDVRVNGHEPMWFMLDTGAEQSFINKTRMAEFGLTPFGASQAEGGGNTAPTQNTKVPVVSLPGVELRNQRHRVIDMSGLEKIYGRKMGGMFGYDFFSRFVVRVDYDRKVIDLLDPAGFKYSGNGKAMPFVIEEGGHPHVTATITVPTPPAISADLVIDSGAADTLNLCTPFVLDHKLLERARKKPPGEPNVLAGSEKEFFAQTSVRGKIGGLTLGAFTVKDIPNNLMVAKTGAYASRAFDGTVGETILRRFTTTYDYARNVIVLEPNADFDKPFKGRRTFGATFLSDGDDYRVFKVTGIRKDSPAEKAGLKKDDIVASIDGKPASELRLAEIRQLFLQDGEKRHVEIKRGDATQALDFVVSTVSLDDE
ncbi:MAG TPA: aspartyl protease family protein [Candidatus Polarisedimenticolaceae bacterium]|nr:aspartyl protease family protein [Candidatus Polarisedimenticolaceae bacterium]